MISQLELPKDLMLGAAIVTITGRKEVLVENYKGIIELEDSLVKIQTKNCRLQILGAHLTVEYYTNEQVTIGFVCREDAAELVEIAVQLAKKRGLE